MNKNITIIGTGAYGTALANVLTDSNNNVVMYGIDEKQIDDINIKNENSTFFGNAKINSKIKATNDLNAALEKTDILILGVPTFALDSILDQIINNAKREMIIINTAKGMDEKKLDLLSKKIITKLENKNVMKAYAALYGPSVAIEVVERKPTAVMIACEDYEIAQELSTIFTNEYFFVYPWIDIVGCEISAALKNTVAIASGILYGLNAGDNAQASLITVGANEMYRIGSCFGAKLETFFNFAGLGDLILTASSQKSRNFNLGRKIAEKKSAKLALEEYKLTVEGVASSKIAYKLCEKYGIETQLFKIIYEILFEDLNPIALVNNVLKNTILV